MLTPTQVMYCGQFKRLTKWSAPNLPKVSVTMDDHQDHCTHLFVVDDGALLDDQDEITIRKVLVDVLRNQGVPIVGECGQRFTVVRH